MLLIFLPHFTTKRYSYRRSFQLDLEKLPYPNGEKTLMSHILLAGPSNGGEQWETLLSNRKNTCPSAEKWSQSAAKNWNFTEIEIRCGSASPYAIGKFISITLIPLWEKKYPPTFNGHTCQNKKVTGLVQKPEQVLFCHSGAKLTLVCGEQHSIVKLHPVILFCNNEQILLFSSKLQC